MKQFYSSPDGEWLHSDRSVIQDRRISFAARGTLLELYSYKSTNPDLTITMDFAERLYNRQPDAGKSFIPSLAEIIDELLSAQYIAIDGKRITLLDA